MQLHGSSNNMSRPQKVQAFEVDSFRENSIQVNPTSVDEIRDFNIMSPVNNNEGNYNKRTITNSFMQSPTHEGPGASSRVSQMDDYNELSRGPTFQSSPIHQPSDRNKEDEDIRRKSFEIWG